MNRKVLDWLLEGPAWLRFSVERQLLDQNPQPDEALADPAVKKLIKELKDPTGLPALKTGVHSYKGKLYWSLFFLADVGFTVKDLGLERAVNAVYDCQQPDGKFRTMKDAKPDFFCIPAILLAALRKMNYDDSGRRDAFLRLVLDSMRLDGGWHCAAQRARGGKLEDTESCPMDNQNLLMLLGLFPEFARDKRFNGAIDLLLTHWERRAEKWRPYGFGVGTDFMKLKYPAAAYGVLRVLDALSLFPYAVKKKGFREMLFAVQAKAVEGKYVPESIVAAFADFDFGQKKVPSRWLTFLVKRLEKRIAEA
jgi:hypothetical protein